MLPFSQFLLSTQHYALWFYINSQQRITLLTQSTVSISCLCKKTEKATPPGEACMVNTASFDDGQFLDFYTMQYIWFVPLFHRNMLPSSSGWLDAELNGRRKCINYIHKFK
jgi:hypothetical protein